MSYYYYAVRVVPSVEVISHGFLQSDSLDDDDDIDDYHGDDCEELYPWDR